MPVKVSVVVPVWNPGEFINACIRTLAEQTMPKDELEAIFVDDGSTDGTGDRLEALAAEHPWITVIRQENSGWPGKPRNVGTERARGDYVLFMDQDDALGPEAVQRMHALGSANDADIVIGKVISDFRGVPHNLFRSTIGSCDYRTAPLIESLTPHKMFRRQFLLDAGIRYPEGPRRLEDQLFMVKAYVAAQRTSIVGDYVCYFYQRRADGKNAGSTPIEPAGYYGNLREILDVIDANVPEGETRDALYRRFYRVELMNRLGGGPFLRHEPDYRAALVEEVRQLLADRFPTSLDHGVPAAMRVRGAVGRRGDVDELVALTERYLGVKAAARLTALRWDGRRYVADVEARMTHDGEPLLLERAGDRLLLPRTLVGDTVSDEDRAVEDQVAGILADVVARERDGAVEWFVPEPLTPAVEDRGDGTAEVVFRGSVPLDASTMSGGDPVPRSVQTFHVRVQFLGLTRQARLGADRDRDAVDELLPALSGSPALVATPYWTKDHDNLSLDVDGADKAVNRRVAVTSLEGPDHGTVQVTVGLRVPDGTPGPSLRLTRAGAHHDVALRPEAGAAGEVGASRTWVGELAQPLARGTWQASLLLPSRGNHRLRAGSIDVGLLGRPRWAPAGAPAHGPVERAVRAAVRPVRRALSPQAQSAGEQPGR